HQQRARESEEESAFHLKVSDKSTHALAPTRSAPRTKPPRREARRFLRRSQDRLSVDPPGSRGDLGARCTMNADCHHIFMQRSTTKGEISVFERPLWSISVAVRLICFTQDDYCQPFIHYITDADHIACFAID